MNFKLLLPILLVSSFAPASERHTLTVMGTFEHSALCDALGHSNSIHRLLTGKTVTEPEARDITTCVSFTKDEWSVADEAKSQTGIKLYVQLHEFEGHYGIERATPVYRAISEIESSSLCVDSSRKAMEIENRFRTSANAEATTRLVQSLMSGLANKSNKKLVPILSAIQLATYLRDEPIKANRLLAEAALCHDLSEQLKSNRAAALTETFAIATSQPLPVEDPQLQISREKKFLKALYVQEPKVSNVFVAEPLFQDNPEKLAIYSYEGYGYRIVNPYLRGKLGYPCKVCQPFIDELKVALAKLPDDRKLVFRGVGRMYGADFSNFDQQLQIGKTLVFDAFSSTSIDIAVGNGYSKDGFLLTILPIHGKRLVLENFSSESEILLTAGTRLRVISRTGTSAILKELP